MAAVAEPVEETKPSKLFKTETDNTVTTYIGISFALFLGLLPRSLESRNKELHTKLKQTEEQLNLMKCRRREDSKANARVVEIFASHRNGWQQEEKRLLQQIDEYVDEITELRAKVEELEKSETELRRYVEKLQIEVDEREEMINFMSRREEVEEVVEVEEVEEEEYFSVRSVEKVEVRSESEVGFGEERDEFVNQFVDFERYGEFRVSDGLDPIPEECYGDASEMSVRFGVPNGFNRDFLQSAYKVWAERNSDQQDTRYDSLESPYHLKHFVARRESPWKVDGESTGVPSKLKLLEQELLNLEKIDKGGLSKVPSLLRKQAKRYKSLAGKIEDLCRRMQLNDPTEPTLSTEFRTRRQTEFLLEACRLQQRAIETGQKLTALQTETAKSTFSNDNGSHAKMNTRRSLDSIRNNFKEIQRNLEIWLARIMGDLEGNLARDGASRVRDYYISSYPFVR